MTSNILKYDNVEYVMPILFSNALYIPVFNKLLNIQHNPMKYAYGSIKSAWTGGRVSQMSINRLEYIDRYLNQVKKYNITPTFTFSSIGLTKEQLNDHFCNSLLDIAYKHNSHLIVADENLYKHIKERYNDAQMVCSVIIPSIKYTEGNFDETKFYNEMLDKYEIVVVRPEWVAENIENLNKIIKDIDRIEVLINQHCQYNCKLCKKHYQLVTDINAGITPLDEYNKFIKNCPMHMKDYKYRSVYMSPEFVDKLVDIGVKKLKLQGRDFSFMELYDDMYKFIFKDESKKDEIKQKIYQLSAEIIQQNNLAQLNLL